MEPTGFLQGLVLVVDDRKNWRETLEELLQADGHQVRTASSLAEAKASLRAQDFDVAILDIRLLDESRYDVQGLQLLKEIKTMGLRASVIVMTGYAPPDTEACVQQAGADVFTFKTPQGGFDIVQFRATIRDLVQQARCGL
ncbi:MAG: response regulator [Thermoflexales bacterium]|nr:response regulator [Thermoflexales bacterium]